jgi:hypothetical protein
MSTRTLVLNRLARTNVTAGRPYTGRFAQDCFGMTPVRPSVLVTETAVAGENASEWLQGDPAGHVTPLNLP